MNTPTIDEPLMTFRETMTYLKVSRSTVYRLMAQDKLTGYKIGANGTHWKFRKSDVQAMVRHTTTKEKEGTSPCYD